MLHLDGDVENSSSEDTQSVIIFTDQRTMTAKTLLTLEATGSLTKGELLYAGFLTLNAGSGIVIFDDLLSEASNKALVLDADHESYNDGTLTIVSSKTVNSNDSDVIITAWDIDLDADMITGTGFLSIHGSQSDQTIGLGGTPSSMHINDSELGRITTDSGLRLGTDVGGSITVNGTTKSSSYYIPLVSIIAMQDDAEVHFLAHASTFQALYVKSDNGIIIDTRILTHGEASGSTGSLHLHGDGDNQIDPQNTIKFMNASHISAQTRLTLQDSTGGILMAGSFTLTAGNGITILDDMASEVKSETLVLDADEDRTGDGTLTVYSGKNIITNDSAILITAVDLDLESSPSAATLNAGSSTLKVYGALTAQTIGIGVDSITADMVISDAELGNMVATGGTTIGNSLSGDIIVNGVSEASTDMLGTILLLASKADKTIAFIDNPTSFDKGIFAHAAGGMILSTSVSTKSTPLVLNTGTGSLTITSGQLLTTNNQMLTITTSGFEILSEISSGTAALQITTPPGRSIGVMGVAHSMNQVGDVFVHADDLRRFVCNGLSIGMEDVNGSINVNGVTVNDNVNIQGTFSLIATSDDAQINFYDVASTFGALAVQADNGVVVEVDITTTIGSIYLDADFENSSSEDGLNTIGFTDGRTIWGKTEILFEASTSHFNNAGELTLLAGDGIHLLDSLYGTSNNKTVVINSDYETSGNGIFTLAASKVLDSNDSVISISAWAIDLDGTLDAGSTTACTVCTIDVHAQDNQEFSIGVASAGWPNSATPTSEFEFSNPMLGRVISSGGITLGDSSNGIITVNGVTNDVSDTLGRLTLIATQPSITVVFNGNDSDFNKGITIQSMGGIVLSQSVSTKNTNSIFSAGTGTLTILGTKQLTTTGQVLTMTLDDIVLETDATINVANSTVTMATYYENRPVGLGIGQALQQSDFRMSDAELGQITALGGLTIGGPINGDITIGGITEANSDSVGILTLTAGRTFAGVTFLGVASSFNKGVTIQADAIRSENH